CGVPWSAATSGGNVNVIVFAEAAAGSAPNSAASSKNLPTENGEDGARMKSTSCRRRGGGNATPSPRGTGSCGKFGGRARPRRRRPESRCVRGLSPSVTDRSGQSPQKQV